MLLDQRLSELDRHRLQSTYDHQQHMLDELDRGQQRNREMEQKSKEILLDTQYRELTLKYAEASTRIAESQAEAAER